jgi:hypothetical protein
MLRSADFGRSWSERFVANIRTGSTTCSVALSPVTAVDAAGTVYVVWSAGDPALPTGLKEAETLVVFLSYSLDHGQTWTAPRVISNPAKDSRMPWITAGAPGRVSVAWYENTRGLPGETVPDEWNVRLWESVTADSERPESVTILLNTAPSHLGTICTSGLTCSASDRSLLDFFEITLDNRGQPVAAWMNSQVGTGVGLAVAGPDTWFGGVAKGTPLR